MRPKVWFSLMICAAYGVLEWDITEVFMEILLLYTNHVTFAGIDRLFSKPKMIKHYLRNSTRQD